MSLHMAQIRKWITTSPPGEWALNHLREMLIGALRQGPLPQHVAFVMDGNRRFARTHKIETVEGHNLGFEALAKVITLDVVCVIVVLMQADIRSMLQIGCQMCYDICFQHRKFQTFQVRG